MAEPFGPALGFGKGFERFVVLGCQPRRAGQTGTATVNVFRVVPGGQRNIAFAKGGYPGLVANGHGREKGTAVVNVLGVSLVEQKGTPAVDPQRYPSPFVVCLLLQGLPRIGMFWVT